MDWRVKNQITDHSHELNRLRKQSRMSSEGLGPGLVPVVIIVIAAWGFIYVTLFAW